MSEVEVLEARLAKLEHNQVLLREALNKVAGALGLIRAVSDPLRDEWEGPGGKVGG
jgi:hypothetical protein